MQIENIAQVEVQAFESVLAGNCLTVSDISLPTAASIERRVADMGLSVKVTTKPDGQLVFSAYDLHLDTELEFERHGVLTTREALTLLLEGDKWRCQAPFRESDSYAAFLRRASDGRPFVHDTGTGTSHWLNDADWFAVANSTVRYQALIEPLFHIQDYSAMRFLGKEPPPRRWLFQDVLPFGKVGVIVAPGGTGKSQFMLQMGVAVACGMPLAGSWAVGESGGVLMLLAEDDEDELHRRLNNIMSRMAQTRQHAEIQNVRANLIIKSMVGENNQMTSALLNRDVEQTVYVDRLIVTAKQVPNLKLIIFDPASRFRGGDENDAQDTTRFVEAVERVSQATGATVLFAHHTSKASMQATEASQAASRGSSALSDGVRWQMNLAKLTERESKEYGIDSDRRSYYLKASVTKNNYAPPIPDMILQRGEGGYLEKVSLAPAKLVIEQHLQERIIGLVKAERLHGRSYSKTAFEDKVGGKLGQLKAGKNAVRFALNALLGQGRLVLDRTNKLTTPGM